METTPVTSNPQRSVSAVKSKRKTTRPQTAAKSNAKSTFATSPVYKGMFKESSPPPKKKKKQEP